MRSPTTTANFAAELQRIDDLNAGWMTAEAIEQRRAAALSRHAAYDEAVTHAVDAVNAIPAPFRSHVRRQLERIDTEECPSGSYDCAVTQEQLVGFNIRQPWRLFTHDLRFLATLLGDGK